MIVDDVVSLIPKGYKALKNKLFRCKKQQHLLDLINQLKKFLLKTINQFKYFLLKTINQFKYFLLNIINHKKIIEGLSNFDIEEIFNKANNSYLLQNFVGAFPSDKMNKFLDFKKMMKGEKHPFLIANTGRSDKQGTHWWSILDIDGKKDFLLFDSFGIKGLKNFIVKDDERIVAKVLKGVENLKEDKEQINLVNVNFVKNSYLKLSEGEKATLSETCTDFLHFLESFSDYENQSLIHLWLLEDPNQDITTIACGYFQTIFYRNLFFSRQWQHTTQTQKSYV